jgi:RimJ/RimL family protein N-acetyltransferase
MRYPCPTGDSLLSTMSVSLKSFTREYAVLFQQWAKISYVRDTWFQPGYASVDEIIATADGNGYDFPYLIMLGDEPIGFLLLSDVHLYYGLHPEAVGALKAEPVGTFSADIFIAAESNLGRGYGTAAMQMMIAMVSGWLQVKRLVIEPNPGNQRAIRCYEKAGFCYLRHAHDGVAKVLLMELALTR